MISRLESIAKSKELEGVRVVITGCGYKPLRHTFYDIVTKEPSHDTINVEGHEMKLNIGAATAGVLARKGAIVHMISTSEDKLKGIEQSLEGKIEYSVLDLLDEKAVKEFVRRFKRDKPIYWVQSVGLNAGSYKLKDDNPYLPIEEIPVELIEQESRTVLRATHLMMKEFLPIFRKQKETRVAVVSSMSAVRGYALGCTHCAAKGAIDRYANAAMLSGWKENLFVTTVRPGAVDTGMYDAPAVQKAIKQISDYYGGTYKKHFALMPPTAVGEAIANIFTIPAHVPSINIVAKGQFPNEGS